MKKRIFILGGILTIGVVHSAIGLDEGQGLQPKFQQNFGRPSAPPKQRPSKTLEPKKTVEEQEEQPIEVEKTFPPIVNVNPWPLKRGTQSVEEQEAQPPKEGGTFFPTSNIKETPHKDMRKETS